MSRRNCTLLALAALLTGCTSFATDQKLNKATDGKVVIDDCDSLEVSQKVWKMEGLTAEISPDHATGGKGCLKATFSKDGGAIFFGSKEQPMDWSRYKSVGFDVYNPQDQMMMLVIRIDDADSTGYKERFEPSEDLFLPPKKLTHVEIDLTNIWANNGRLMDTSKIVVFNVHASKAPAERVLFFDSFRFLELPEKDWPKQIEPAKAPLVLDDGKSTAKSAGFWKASSAKFEVSAEHAAEGQGSLKVAVPKDGAALVAGVKDKPLDLSAYRSLQMEVFNAGSKDLKLTVRLDDPRTVDNSSRFIVPDIVLPAGKATPVKINFDRPALRCGLKMDKSRITGLALSFANDGEEAAVFVTNLRADPEKGGLKNELLPGRIPGQTPETLGKALLEDPEIKPLIPVFKAMGAHKFAICSHSASISAHWSTSGGFVDIAFEAIKAVNPQVEYKGFHAGGMGADRAVKEFLPAMIEYKPTDTYLLVVPSTMEAHRKLIADMTRTGSKVFVFDAVKPCGAYSPKQTEDLREQCKAEGATFIELMARGWGAPGCPRWTTTDGIHMVTAGHVFYARELLKDMAKIYAPAAASNPAK